MTVPESGGRRPRLLVAIASYGEKNLAFLKRIIANYRSLPMQVDVVVLSEAPKDLGAGVKVLVGLPSKNPWSLPFAHKALFAENLDRYDLFIYSEDDIEVTETNVQAFLRATPHMQPDEIVGFLRFEVDKTGTRSMPEVHGRFHWKPESVGRRGPYTVAEFTNEHAAFYLLTQDQLRQAIRSGGFLRAPYEGRHDMLCTAATDPYTSCGFRKVICVSAIGDFLVHHMPNRYVGQMGISLASFQEQIQTLEAIGSRAHPASTLCPLESKLLHGRWSKLYYEDSSEAALRAVPADAKSILSIGCGWGAMEAALQARGAAVTAVPLDSVIGAAATRRHGFEMIYGDWNGCLDKLTGRKFDVVLMMNLLHLLPEPGRALEQSSRFLGTGGILVVGGPNFDRLPTWFRRTFGINDERKLRNFDQSDINRCGPRTLRRHLRNAGLQVTAVEWLDHRLSERKLRAREMPLGSFTARDWLLKAKR